jgi:hypothetical protein
MRLLLITRLFCAYCSQTGKAGPISGGGGELWVICPGEGATSTRRVKEQGKVTIALSSLLAYSWGPCRKLAGVWARTMTHIHTQRQHMLVST